MSNLHKRIKAHEHMTLEEKENCQCEMCKGLKVGKVKVFSPGHVKLEQAF